LPVMFPDSVVPNKEGERSSGGRRSLVNASRSRFPLTSFLLCVF
jgi:hypothetical protein